jgi:hypothetical protein
LFPLQTTHIAAYQAAHLVGLLLRIDQIPDGNITSDISGSKVLAGGR